MNSNTEFELFTQKVYQRLLNNDVLEPTIVRHNKKLKGKSGCMHQIDVFWEYEVAGILHRIAIECKNYDSMVPISRVRDFFGVLHDLNNVRGIMVSSKGFQAGAKRFADYYGITLKTLREPCYDDIIGSIIINSNLEILHSVFKVDEQWATQKNFDIKGYRERVAFHNTTTSEPEALCEYVPILTNDPYIRDSKGVIIASIQDLEKQLEYNTQSKVFPFDDGWLNSRYWGPVKINEVKFEYERKVQETALNLAADDFVEAILDDAVSGKTDYVLKY